MSFAFDSIYDGLKVMLEPSKCWSLVAVQMTEEILDSIYLLKELIIL